MHSFHRAMAGLVLAMASASAAAAGVTLSPTTAARDAPAFSTDGGQYTGPVENGRFHGKGRLVWPDGGEYDGEFADGMMHGQGRLNSPPGEVYEGKFVRGQLRGKGSYRGADGLVYEGEFIDTRYEGRGRFDDGRGTVYEGMFKAGLFNGQGKLRTVDGEFEGEFARGQLNGLAHATYREGTSYRGVWKHNLFHGRGEFIDARGARYTGDFEQNRFSGYGVHRLPDGVRFEGRFSDWRPEVGRLIDAEGTVFEGSHSSRDGKSEGRISWKDGSRYAGQTQGLSPHGSGVLHKANGDVYRGHFAYGEYDGEGMLQIAKPQDGRKVLAGTWMFGRFKADEDEQLRRAGQAAEDALYAQPALLDQALAKIAPSEPGRIHMYLLAIAGDGSQEVFRREVEFVRRQFDTEYGTAGRSVTLVNSRNTTRESPMASVTSVRRAVDAIAAKMDRQKDILFVFMTSHGSKTHEFSLGLKGLDLPPLTPKELQAMLTSSGIRWKVVVVSACYAGGFIDPLKNEQTLVLAAARHDRKSFGCADENDFTYFGRAYFKEALPKSTSFQEAFAVADKLIERWEVRDHSQPRPRGRDEAQRPFESSGDRSLETTRGSDASERRSLPQIADAQPIARQLNEWWTQRSAR